MEQADRYIEWTVAESEDGRTVQDICLGCLRMGKRAFRHAKYSDRGLLLDGKRVFSNTPVRAGQLVQVLVGDEAERLQALEIETQQIPLDIAYQDEALLVVNKPAKIAMYPSPTHPHDALANYVMGYFESRGVRSAFHPVHRLDRDTSGLVAIALNGHVQHLLSQAIHTDVFHRTYTALVTGAGLPDSGTVDAPIACIQYRPNLYGTREDGKPSVTHYSVRRRLILADGSEAALVDFELETGRTHQIRVHMASIGHALLGDPYYGAETSLIDRTALHSSHMDITHPLTGEKLSLDAPLPDDMRMACELAID